jgi:predicted phage-related endonuclease
MIIDTAVQGTREWKDARGGIPTASAFDMLITSKGEPSKQWQKYMYALAVERITGVKEDGYKNDAMLRGIEMEAEARKMYELITDSVVETVGVCYPDEKKLWGCSPDGLVGKDGALEIKCPTAPVHVEYILEGKLPTAYFQQTQGQLFITGRKWVDFMSYYPGIKPLIIRVMPDKDFLHKLRVELELFTTELNDVVERIK